MEFVAGRIDDVPGLAGALIVSVDLGFSATQRSTGIAISRAGALGSPTCLSFGSAVSATVQALREGANTAALIVEAPLSFFFSSAGNPVGRPFEKPAKPGTFARNWYVGPGASTALAGAFFIRGVAEAALMAVPRICRSTCSKAS